MPTSYFLLHSVKPGFTKSKNSLLSFCILVLFTAIFNNSAYCTQHWDQFRGAERDGRIKLTEGEMVSSSPELLWSREIGSGFSEVVVADESLYLLMSEKVDSLSGWETLTAMNAATGEVIWSTRVDSLYIDVDDWGDGPRSTPAVDENNVYCLSASGKLSAVARKDGMLLWMVDFVQQYGSTRPRWGYSASPLLVDDLLVIEVGGVNDHGFAAFNKSTGVIKWHSGNVDAFYNSAVLVNVNGMQQLIFANSKTLHAYSLKGDSLWSYTMPLRSPTALPLFIEPDLLFVSAANDVGSFIIRLGSGAPEEVLTSSQMRNDFSSSCYKDGFIYGFNVATLQCMDATTGQRKWMKRGFGKGSLIMVGEHLMVFSDLGELAIVGANPDEYRESARMNVLEGRSWTAPSYADGKLYLRNHTRIACVRITEVSK
jgi:outer membrane protein assembly factor BamB